MSSMDMTVQRRARANMVLEMGMHIRNPGNKGREDEVKLYYT